MHGSLVKGEPKMNHKDTIKLKEVFLEALIRRRKFQLASRPLDFKFKENNPNILISLDEFKGLFIGDICSFYPTRNTWYTKNLFGTSWIDEFKSHWKYKICAFIEMTGHLKEGKGIKITDMFCVLIHYSEPAFSSILREIRYSDIVKVEFEKDKESPILLFWTEALKKVVI